MPADMVRSFLKIVFPDSASFNFLFRNSFLSCNLLNEFVLPILSDSFVIFSLDLSPTSQSLEQVGGR